MTHAVINDNLTVCNLTRRYSIGNTHLTHSFQAYLAYNDTGTSSHVPITLLHFRILARLGKPVNWSMFHVIELGAEFFFSEEDYLNKESKYNNVKVEVKSEATQLAIPPPVEYPVASTSKLEKSLKRKRPRRTVAATVRSYAIPDSDDEEIACEDEKFVALQSNAKKRKVESNLQRWIKELSVLLKEEQRKVSICSFILCRHANTVWRLSVQREKEDH